MSAGVCLRDAFLQSLGIGPGAVPRPLGPPLATGVHSYTSSGNTAHGGHAHSLGSTFRTCVDVNTTAGAGTIGCPASKAHRAPVRFLDLVKHAPEDFVVNEVDWAGQVVSVGDG
jgi:hypothetical protein